MKVAVDTNILLRSLLDDDPIQSPLARQLLEEADMVAIPLTAFCEFAWVTGRLFKLPKSDIADTILRLTQSANVVTNQAAVEAGLMVLESGGDFADGVIAFEGKWLGAETFVTFDKQAARLTAKQGSSVKLLGTL